MKSQILFTTLSMAATLATVESFHMIPIGKSPSRPSLSLSSSLQEDNSAASSDGFGLRKMSKDLMLQKKEEDPTAENEIASGYMSLASYSRATPKPLKMSTWKKADTKKEDLARLEFLFESSNDYVTDAEPLSWQ